MNLVWIKNDLRFEDNPALYAAVNDKNPFVILYFENESMPLKTRKNKMGAASWFLYQQLIDFQNECQKWGVPFVYIRELTPKKLTEIITQLKIEKVFYNESICPTYISVQKQIDSLLGKQKVQTFAKVGPNLIEWENHRTQTGQVFQVFTPFWKALWKNRHLVSVPLQDARKVSHRQKITSDDLNIGDSISESDFYDSVPAGQPWYSHMAETQTVGERAALKRLKKFIQNGLSHYKTARDIPSVEGTSRISMDLARGSLSLRTAWHSVLDSVELNSKGEIKDSNHEQFLKELCWREFATYVLYHFPDSCEKSLKLNYEKLDWENSPKKFKAWTRGQTGYPIIDAGMRQLWTTGWMHNRVRMIVGSFLVKDLNIEWQKGAAWFLDTLLDADLANNSLGWQWVAGCGVDAAPYFRVFNPILQGEKFDPDGSYVRHWVPELKHLNKEFIHKPWEAPDNVLKAAKIELGKNYPLPLVDHSTAREEILSLFKSLKK